MALKVTNTSDRVQSFNTTTGARVHLASGETKSIALDRDDPHLKAKENARFVDVEESKAAKPSRTPEAEQPAE